MLLDQSSTDIRLQLNKANFLGRDGFSWWIGQIADLKSTTADEVQLQANESGDPIYYNRVKVRIMGNHTGEGNQLEDKNLPWAHIMIPSGEPNGTLGSGKSHQYKGGETVIGFYLDGDDGQQPIIIGSFYKHSGVITKTNPSKIKKSKSSEYKPFEPTRVDNPQLQNTKCPDPKGGKNVVTKVETPITPSEAQKPGLETTVVGSKSGEVKDKSRAACVFSEKSNDCTTPVEKCEQDEISRITKQITELQKTLSKVQEYQGKFINYVSGQIIDLDNKIKSLATKITETISGLIKDGQNKLYKVISKKVNELFDKLFPKNKQAKAGKQLRTLTSALYCLFKKIVKSLFNLVLKIITDLLDQLFANLICNVNSLINTVFNTVFETISNLLNPIISAINVLLGGSLGSINGIINKVLGIANVIKSLLNCEESPCKSDNEKFCMNNGPTTSSIPSFSSIFADSSNCSNIFECGPPSVQFLGGGGLGAVANAVINDIGQVLGFDIINGGSGYTESPIVSLKDSCNNGSGSVLGSAIVENGIVVAVPTINPGSGYLNTIVAVVPGEDPTPQPNLIIENLIPEIDFIYINGGGIAYSSDDTVDAGDGQWQVVTGPNGIIIGLDSIKLPNPTGTRVPDVTINSSTGVGAILVPVIKFTKLKDANNIQIDPNKIIQVIDCVQR